MTLIYRRIQILLSVTLLMLLTATVTLSQERPVTSDSALATVTTAGANATDLCVNVGDCLKVIDKLLGDLDGKDAVVTAIKAENANKATIIKDQDERFAKMLVILQDFAGAEKANKKDFWKAVGTYLKKVLKTLTEPETIRSVLDVIVLVKALER